MRYATSKVATPLAWGSQFSRITQVGLLCSLVLMSLAAPSAAQSISWTAPDFVVLPIDPFEKLAAANNGQIPNNSSLNSMLLQQALTGQSQLLLTAEATANLNEVRSMYEQGGIKEPINLNPMFNSTTRGVFMFTFPGSIGDPDTKDAFAFYISAICQASFKQSWMAVNTNRSGIWQYKSIAHELFHPIQYQYPWSKDPNNNPLHCGNDYTPWIFEGTADAAGFFLMGKKMTDQGLSLPTEAGTNFDDYTKFYGVRPYDVPLEEASAWNLGHVKARFRLQTASPKTVKSKFGYRTSSFWRFLIDRWDNSPKYDPKRFQALSEAFMKRVGPDVSVVG